jgi:hypothetical protein
MGCVTVTPPVLQWHARWQCEQDKADVNSPKSIDTRSMKLTVFIVNTAKRNQHRSLDEDPHSRCHSDSVL